MPFERAGWNCIQWDIKLDEFMDINFIEDAEAALDLFESVDGIIAGPPCTDFTSSGAQYWPAKDANGRTEAALQLVHQVQRLADLYKPTDPDFYEESGNPFFWAVENPVGRLTKLAPGLGAPTYYQPHDFAGYVIKSKADLRRLEDIRAKDGKGVTAAENDFVIQAGAYSKKTGLWGEYNRQLVVRPVLPVKTAPQGSFTQRLGGKSDRTKELRSMTPAGMAEAFYQANKDYQAPLQGWD